MQLRSEFQQIFGQHQSSENEASACVANVFFSVVREANTGKGLLALAGFQWRPQGVIGSWRWDKVPNGKSGREYNYTV